MTSSISDRLLERREELKVEDFSDNLFMYAVACGREWAAYLNHEERIDHQPITECLCDTAAEWRNARAKAREHREKLINAYKEVL